MIYDPDEPEIGIVSQQGRYHAVAVGIDTPVLTLYSATNILDGPASDSVGRTR